jgi:hypothetical protein
MSAARVSPPRFKAGDWVTFQYGLGTATARIVERRGFVGAERIQVYHIEMPREGLEPDRFDLLETDMEPAPAPPAEARAS